MQGIAPRRPRTSYWRLAESRVVFQQLASPLGNHRGAAHQIGNGETGRITLGTYACVSNMRFHIELHAHLKLPKALFFGNSGSTAICAGKAARSWRSEQASQPVTSCRLESRRQRDRYMRAQTYTFEWIQVKSPACAILEAGYIVYRRFVSCPR